MILHYINYNHGRYIISFPICAQTQLVVTRNIMNYNT